jgi:hypothetical protein
MKRNKGDEVASDGRLRSGMDHVQRRTHPRPEDSPLALSMGRTHSQGRKARRPPGTATVSIAMSRPILRSSAQSCPGACFNAASLAVRCDAPERRRGARAPRAVPLTPARDGLAPVALVIAKFSSAAGTSPIARQGATGRALRSALPSAG